jgi:ABC-type nickel/cobalt efflux system permease component RcnA
VFSILLAMAAGVPLYVCATASVPIAAGLIYLGASPGTALAFLITGPASNPAAFTTIWKVLGRRTALLYLATVAISAMLCGLLLDAIFLLPALKAWLPHPSAHTAMHFGGQAGWLSSIWAAALLAVFAVSWLASRRRLRRAASLPAAPRPGAAGSCQHSQPHHSASCACEHSEPHHSEACACEHSEPPHDETCACEHAAPCPHCHS